MHSTRNRSFRGASPASDLNSGPVSPLKGILFIDYLSKLKKSMIIKKLSKQKSKSERIIV